jgi:hypothetical protein
MLLVLAGTAVGLGVSLRGQQVRFDGDPSPIGPRVTITSGDNWALIAWRSRPGMCLAFAVQENSTLGCGFPVRGTSGSTPGYAGPPTHAVEGTYSGSTLQGVVDGKATFFGVAASDVSAVKVELSDGQLVGTELFDAPPDLVDHVRFFIARISLGNLERAGLAGSPYTAFRAYDRNGRLIERAEA